MDKSQLYKQVGREIENFYWVNGSIYSVSYETNGHGSAFLDVEEVPGDGGYRNVFYIVVYSDEATDNEIARFNCDQLAGWKYVDNSTAPAMEEK